MHAARPSRHERSLPGDGLGAVFTRRWAADLVLDLAGYSADRDLAAGTVLEPACGTGAFLVPIIDRLAASCRAHDRRLADAGAAVRAFDLDPGAVTASRTAVRDALRSHGLDARTSARLAKTWVTEADFLTRPIGPGHADWVVGNPPYVRLEDVDRDRSDRYRRAWPTMTGRADVYVGFFEAGLSALRPGGVLSFICADRWMRNQYGRRLRALVEDGYAVDTVLTLHDADTFEDRVAAYPAIVVLRHGTQRRALVADADGTFGPEGATRLARAHRAGPRGRTTTSGPGFTAAWTRGWFSGGGSWPTGAPTQLERVADLERRFPALGDPASGATIGIGIATGADNVFLTTDPDAAERTRLLPIAVPKDLQDGKVVWSGTHLLNPWTDTGDLVNLDDHPRLRAHYTDHEPRLRNRHVGQRQPDRWYRTIDKPVPGLAASQKLLLPDLRMRVDPVLETGSLYPHHNLFWIQSDAWDLRVLGGLLLSDFGTLFVETYSPRMAGGALRVTSQYLRRIRVPQPAELDPEVAGALASAFDARDIKAATDAARAAYLVGH